MGSVVCEATVVEPEEAGLAISELDSVEEDSEEDSVDDSVDDESIAVASSIKVPVGCSLKNKRY